MYAELKIQHYCLSISFLKCKGKYFFKFLPYTYIEKIYSVKSCFNFEIIEIIKIAWGFILKHDNFMVLLYFCNVRSIHSSPSLQNGTRTATYVFKSIQFKVKTFTSTLKL